MHRCRKDMVVQKGNHRQNETSHVQEVGKKLISFCTIGSSERGRLASKRERGWGGGSLETGILLSVAKVREERGGLHPLSPLSSLSLPSSLLGGPGGGMGSTPLVIG